MLSVGPKIHVKFETNSKSINKSSTSPLQSILLKNNFLYCSHKFLILTRLAKSRVKSWSLGLAVDLRKHTQFATFSCKLYIPQLVANLPKYLYLADSMFVLNCLFHLRLLTKLSLQVDILRLPWKLELGLSECPNTQISASIAE